MNKSELGITRENLLLIVPPALTQDPAMMARAAADAEAMETRLAEIDKVRIISNIDGLNETVLDILARDFKVDWWDPEYSIEEKRRTLKGSWRVHKILGTKAAVETAISAIYPNTQVKEWFEYEGGEPYHFKLTIDISKERGDRTRPLQVLERVNFYKSLRSHLDVIEYLVNAPVLERPIFAAPYPGGLLSSTQLPKIEPELRPARLFTVPGLWGNTAIQHLPVKRPPFDGNKTFTFSPLLEGSFTVTALPILLRPASVKVAPRMGRALSMTELPKLNERNERI